MDFHAMKADLEAHGYGELSETAFRDAYRQTIDDGLAAQGEHLSRQFMPGAAPLPKRNVFQRAASRLRGKRDRARERFALRVAPWLEPPY